MVSKEQVIAIAKLARLRIPDGELEQFTVEFNQILDYIEQLQKLGELTIEPMSHVHGVSNVFREDGTSPGLSTDEALSNGPETSGHFFKVPIIIDPSAEH